MSRPRFPKLMQAAVACSALLLFVPVMVRAADWGVSDAKSETSIDYGAWNDAISATSIEQNGRTLVAYRIIDKRTIAYLDGLLSSMASVNPDQLNRNEQLAYWLNLHNALTLKLLAKDYTPNIERVRAFPSSEGKLFSQPAVVVAGVSLSPDQIVNDVLRVHFKGTNFHYGLFTGAVGSPSLPRQAFTGAQVEAQLQQAARAYVNSRYGVQARKGKVEASSLYDWYKADFGGSDEAVLDHLRQYADAKLARDLAGVTSIAEFRYDYRLAEFVPPPLSQPDVGRSSVPSGPVGGGS